MLRRLISTSMEDNWEKLPLETKSLLKQDLLSSIPREADSSVRKKISDVIAELSRFLIGSVEKF